MTFNGSWGYFPTAPAEDWHTSRQVVAMLRNATAGAGNLLLNIGPAPDGSVPPLAYERLLPVGRWLARHGEAVYGKKDRVHGRLEELNHGDWTVQGSTAWYWTGRWVGSQIAIGGLRTPVRRISLVGAEGEVAFTQSKDRLVMTGLPDSTPDSILAYAVLRLDFERPPRQVLGEGCVVI